MARSIYTGELYDLVYGFDNYMIKYDESNIDSNLCVIYCSSSGIYFPNTEEAFEEAFIKEKDKYEWKNNIVNRAYKHIWIRDITKEFYVKGINKEINNISKLVEFMRNETQNLRVITIGSSAGGYIATLLGCALKAEWVYCFSGYYDLNILDANTWPLIRSTEVVRENGKWYDLRKLLRKENVKVLYFYPNKLKGDREQAKVVKSMTNVYSFRLNSKVHGIPFGDRKCINEVINNEFTDDQLSKLKKLQGKKIYRFMWEKYFMGVIRT